MRRARIVTAIILATALAACGNEDTNPPGGAGGTGGTGGEGGAGGTGGDSVVDCGGVRVLELDGSTSPAVLTDSTDTVDNWTGSCSPETTVGNDVIVHFTAGAEGFYLFSTAGSEFDTLIYAYHDCIDQFSEFKCNDDAAGGKQSQFLLPLTAGEEVFVVVDGVNVRQSQPFTLTASLVEAQKPVIETIEAFANRSVGTTAVRFSGTNPDAAISAFSMQLYGDNGGALLGEPFVARFDQVEFMTLTQADGAFSVEGAFYLGDNAPAVDRVEIKVIDENDFTSDPASDRTDPPESIARGEPCDPFLAFNVCPAEDACVARPPATEPTCSVATAPTPTSATVTVNLAEGVWGLVVEGSDAESDVTYARVLPYTSGGSQPPILQQGRTLVPFHQIGHDDAGNFRGVMVLAARFDGKCLPPAQELFNDCASGCGNDQACAQACYDEAIALLYQCYADTLPTMATVDVEVADLTNKISSVIKATVTAAPAVAEGGVCDPYGAIGICPEGLVCWSEDDYVAETCQVDGPACPAEYGVVDLLAHASGDTWVYEGNNEDSTVTGGASCGGGGPTDVLSFTAPTAGTYRFQTAVTGSSNTLVSARRFCQIPAYEVACNDDYMAGSKGSRIELTLAEGETTYVLVDSYDPAGIGAYTITVSRP